MKGNPSGSLVLVLWFWFSGCVWLSVSQSCRSDAKSKPQVGAKLSHSHRSCLYRPVGSALCVIYHAEYHVFICQIIDAHVIV